MDRTKSGTELGKDGGRHGTLRWVLRVVHGALGDQRLLQHLREGNWGGEQGSGTGNGQGSINGALGIEGER